MDGVKQADRTAQLRLPDEDATTRFAAWIGARLGAGDVLLLSGPIGAGKSHFARALIRSRLPEDEDATDIPSPTFTLVQTYQASDGTEIWHADLYRLTSGDEIAELGLLEAFETALCLIEWPDRLGPDTPDTALSLHFTPDDTGDARSLRIRGGSRHAALLSDIAALRIWTQP
jgi:tRNA threonylcarbamoyl adenosine modification protein YjeE